jgi:subtilase family serine protease
MVTGSRSKDGSENLSLRFAFVSICTAGLLLLGLPAQAQRQVLQTRSAAPPKARPVGQLPTTQELNLAFTLPLRNEVQLELLIQQLYDPGSPEYRHFLTVQQFTDQFGPTAADYDEAIAFAAKYGLTVTNASPNRLVLDVRGTVAQIERAFQVHLLLYKHPTEGRPYHAPDVEPSVDTGVPIQGVNGLNDFEPPHPIGFRQTSLKQIAAGTQSSSVAHGNQTGSGPFGFFLGSDMRAAYYGGTALMGTGQAVGLFEFGPYNLSDVQAYFNFVNQPLNVPIVNVLLDGVSGICGAGCDDGEEVIDIQQAVSMAPGLSAVIVYEGNNDTDMFNQMAVDNVAKQLSCSFGFLPPDPQSDEPIFQEFAAQGQNLFVASGDGGAYFGDPTACANFSNLNGCVFYPADDPFITAAGGTNLTTNGPAGPWQSETGWIGSGGGFSTNGLSIPSYQVPVINATNQGSATLRSIPDVAAEANTDNLFCANGGCFIGVGGTSLSAPRWAGFLALANEQSDGPAIGFLNPTIYSIGQGPNYSSDFHDITSGNNFNSGSPSLFTDVAGYDLVSGWGSPNGQSLLNALGPAFTGPNFGLTASVTTLHIAQGGTGSSTIDVNAANGFTGTVDLRAVALRLPAGLTATLSSSAVAAGGNSVLTISTTSVTPGGNFLVAVTGASGGLSHTAYVTVALPGFTITTPSNVFLNQGSTASATVAINDVNGFNGSVKLSTSGLPKGLSATFSSPHTPTTSAIAFSASGAAATGFASVTITGTSGNITQTATITLAVSAATRTTGTGMPVDLSAAFNVNGAYTDGTTYNTGGLDGGGFSYSANQLTPSRVLSGVQFQFGPANQLNAVGGTGQAVTLPAGQFPRLVLLATGVQGNQTGQTVTVTYTDGTSTQFVQSFSDWFTPQNFPGEIDAVVMPYRNFADGSQDNRPFSLYAYVFRLNSSKTVKSITLPNNPDVLVLAATLLGD